MNAIVEVATAELVAKTTNVSVFAVIGFLSLVEAPQVSVATSSVVSISGHSISAVAPDTIFRKELALAGAA